MTQRGEEVKPVAAAGERPTEAAAHQAASGQSPRPGNGYYALYDRAPVAYLTLDDKAVITAANQRASRLLGVARIRLIGAPFGDLIVAQDQGRFAEQYPQIIAALGGGGDLDDHPDGDSPESTCELRLATASGERIVLFEAASGSASAGGPCIHVVLIDITEQRRAQAALRAEVVKRERTEKTLRKERDFAEGLIAAVPGILMELDREGRIVRCNGFFQQLLGYSAEEVRGADPIELLIPGTARATMRARLQPLQLGAGEVTSGEIVPILTRSGQECIVTWSYSPLTDEQNNVVGVLIIGLDITERTRLEANLRQSQKMEAIGRLASGIAHDFNNLLMGLTGLVEIAASKLPPQSAARPYLAKVKRAASAGAGLTSQLLDFSRKRPVERATMDLNRLVKRAESMLRCLVPASIEMQFHLSGPLWVQGDTGQLEQVLLNLVANARDAMPRGGTLTITTAGSCPRADTVPGALAEAGVESFATLAVTDTGIGMDEETQRRVFEPFFTTKPIGEGTGLGLATVYGTVVQTGGHTHLTSALGQGTTFRICLPQVAPPALLDEPPGPDLVAKGDGETILVIEDEAFVRATIRHRLEERGYIVLTAANGEEALRVCRERQGPISLCVTDIILPGPPGDEVARELVKLRPGLPVLYISALPQDRLVREGRIDSQAVSLQKPFSERELLVAVRDLLAPQSGPVPTQIQARQVASRTSQPVVLLVENGRYGNRALKELLSLADYSVLQTDRSEAAHELVRGSGAMDLVIIDYRLRGQPADSGLQLMHQLLASRPGLGGVLIADGEVIDAAALRPRLRVVREPLDFEKLLKTMAELLAVRA